VIAHRLPRRGVIALPVGASIQAMAIISMHRLNTGVEIPAFTGMTE
jgi:hypothetical protein